jgi:tripartite ATP-independent transporter DctM subunit
MDPGLTGALAFLVLLILLFLGAPVGFALGSIGLVGMWLAAGPQTLLTMAQTLPHSFGSNYSWAVLPLFILMGNLAAGSELTRDVFRAATQWFRPFRGGLYFAVVVGSALFSAVSGSTTANAVVFTRLCFPEMVRLGCSSALTLGCICSSAAFAAMIPPSLTMVIVGMLTEQSIGRLLVAGIVPGLLTACAYGLMLTILTRLRPDLSPTREAQRPSWQDLSRSLSSVLPIGALFSLIMGGLYAGWFPPSAAGAVGALGAFLLMIGRKGFQVKLLSRSILDSVAITSSLLAILMGGRFFSRFLAMAGVMDRMIETVNTLGAAPTKLIVALTLFYLILGCVLDTASIMVVTLPAVFPLILRTGINPIWFSIIFVKLIEIAVLSPPIGINLFATLAATRGEATLGELIVGLIPFLATEAVILTVLILFPEISTWLPGHMMR